MISTIGYYEKLLPPLKLEFERTKILISDKWKENYEQVNRQIIKQTKNLNNKLSICRSNKFNCDKLNYNLAVPILIELWKEGPSFVPVPSSYNCLQLEKIFDAFRNGLWARYLFRYKNNNYMCNVYGPPIKNCSNWRSPKTNYPELETFLTSVEKDLFQNTKVDNKA